MEKDIAYTTLFCATIPLLCTVIFFLNKNVLKVTVLQLGILLILYFILRFQYSWIIWLNKHLRPLYV